MERLAVVGHIEQGFLHAEDSVGTGYLILGVFFLSHRHVHGCGGGIGGSGGVAVEGRFHAFEGGCGSTHLLGEGKCLLGRDMLGHGLHLLAALGVLALLIDRAAAHGLHHGHHAGGTVTALFDGARLGELGGGDAGHGAYEGVIGRCGVGEQTVDYRRSGLKIAGCEEALVLLNPLRSGASELVEGQEAVGYGVDSHGADAVGYIRIGIGLTHDIELPGDFFGGELFGKLLYASHIGLGIRLGGEAVETEFAAYAEALGVAAHFGGSGGEARGVARFEAVVVDLDGLGELTVDGSHAALPEGRGEI